MRNLHFNDALTKSGLSLFCAVVLCGLSISCSNDDDKDTTGNHRNHAVKTFDDLAYFQGIFVEVDSLGHFIHRSIGQPISTLDEDTTHLFVGVKNIAEARKYFDMALAPDVSRSVSEADSYTCTLTNFDGTEQGTVCFAPGTETNHIAEITTDLPGLKHFRRITFLSNSAWPKVANAGKYKLGDSRQDDIEVDYVTEGRPRVQHYTQKFVCVREKSNGVNPLYVGITDDEALGGDIRIPSKWCPASGNANMIAGLIKSDFVFYKACFDMAGIPLNAGELYWFDDARNYVVYNARACIYLDSGEVDYWDYIWQSPRKSILMKIDWETD